MRTRLVLLFIFCAPTIVFRAQEISLAWHDVPEQTGEAEKPVILPLKYKTYIPGSVDVLRDLLFSVSAETSSLAGKPHQTITLPLPDGSIQRFYISESPVLPSTLRNAFPEIRSYSLKGIDDPYASGKLDWNVFGLHAVVISPRGNFFIDPFNNHSNSKYICYYTRDFNKDMSVPFSEEMLEVLEEQEPGIGLRTAGSGAQCVGPTLLNYRLALACTHQYAMAVTGHTAPTMVQTLSKMVVTLNRVNGVFEREAAIRLILVPTTTAVIFTSSSNDPFTANSNLMQLILQSQKFIDSLVGNNNYDIGHTLSTAGGGLAQVGSICVKGKKAQAATGSSKPAGDPFDIDYVAHEMGHQVGAGHTFNAVTGSCNGNRKAVTAAEPGSGITIMGYAGICGMNNLGNNSIPYFHAKSYDEIVTWTRTSTVASCYVEESTGNNYPVVMPLPSQYTIPRGTPFLLKGSALDPDGDSLTYSWEEVSPAPSAANWNADVKPYFRSYAPSANPERSFPSEEVLRSGDYIGTPGEFLSSKAQSLAFRFTVRDNRNGGGGVCSDSTIVTMTTAGPFSVSIPSKPAIVWGQKTYQEITWAVNNTASPPLSCSKVDILCSINDGESYFMLKADVKNDGSEFLQLPAVHTTMDRCRIKIQSVGNIFFDVSDDPFTISPDSTVGLLGESITSTKGWKIMPNPFSGPLYFVSQNLPRPFSVNYKVYDITGRLVSGGAATLQTNGSYVADLSALTAGMYLFELNNGAFTEQHRVVKE